MDGEIINKLNNVSLSESESSFVDVGEEDLRTARNECEQSCYALIAGESTINTYRFRMAMGRAWNCHSFTMQKVDEHIWQIFFGSAETVKHALENGPWNFEDQLVMLRPWKEETPIHLADFENEVFWIQITGLPRICYTLEVGMKIGSTFQSCKEVQIRENQKNGERLFRIRAKINVLNPLRRCIKVRSPDGKIRTGLIKLERLPLLCYFCGTLGHKIRECGAKPSDFDYKQDLPFGPWMKGTDCTQSSLIIKHRDPTTFLHSKKGTAETAETEKDEYIPKEIMVHPTSQTPHTTTRRAPEEHITEMVNAETKVDNELKIEMTVATIQVETSNRKGTGGVLSQRTKGKRVQIRRDSGRNINYTLGKENNRTMRGSKRKWDSNLLPVEGIELKQIDDETYTKRPRRQGNGLADVTNIQTQETAEAVIQPRGNNESHVLELPGARETPGNSGTQRPPKVL